MNALIHISTFAEYLQKEGFTLTLDQLDLVYKEYADFVQALEEPNSVAKTLGHYMNTYWPYDYTSKKRIRAPVQIGTRFGTPLDPYLDYDYIQDIHENVPAEERFIWSWKSSQKEYRRQHPKSAAP